MKMLTVVSMVSVNAMTRLSNKPVGRSIYTKVKQQKAFLQRKQDTEKAEPVKDVYGNTSITSIDSSVCSKIVLSNDVIRKLMEFNECYGDPYSLLSWDQIMLRILSIANGRVKRRRD